MTNTVIKSTRLAAIIDFAADLVEQHGWIKGEMWEHAVHFPADDVIKPVVGGEYQGGAMCTEGALRTADLMVHTDITYPNQSEIFIDVMHAVHSLVPDFKMRIGGHGELSATETWKKRPSIAFWNDFACCTREEAVEFLRDCAIKTMPDESRVGVNMHA